MVLKLRENKISDRGAESLGKMLQNNKVRKQSQFLLYTYHLDSAQTLTTLDLGRNLIGPNGAQHLASGLQNHEVASNQ